jgi:hypothetical protein
MIFDIITHGTHQAVHVRTRHLSAGGVDEEVGDLSNDVGGGHQPEEVGLLSDTHQSSGKNRK